MSLSPIIALKHLFKISLNIELPELKDNKNYVEVLNMLKEIKIENRAKINLLIILFEQMFISKGMLKQCESEKKIKEFTSICDIKDIPKKMREDPELRIIMKLFSFIEIE